MSSVASIMTKQPKSVGPTTSVVSAAKTMNAARVGSLFVKKGKQLVGIVTDTDIVRRAVSSGKPLGKLTVEKIMTAPIRTIEASRPVDDAQDMMGDLQHPPSRRDAERRDYRGRLGARSLLHYKRYAQSKIPPAMGYDEPKIGQD